MAISEGLGGFGKSFFDLNGIPLLFQIIKVILGLVYWVVFGICCFIGTISMLVLLLGIALILKISEWILYLLSNAVIFYYPKFNGYYFYNAMAAVMFLPPVYSTGEISFSFVKKIGSFFAFCLVSVFEFGEWLLVEFFSIASKKRRQEIKALRAAKKREKEESSKIKEALRKEVKKDKEAKRMEIKSVPKLPAKLDNDQISRDISYLQTLPDKGYLIKYAGSFIDRFIAKGQAKTYQEIQKVIRAKTEVEKALEDLIIAQEGRYTAQEKAQAKNLLETLQAQAAIRKHYNQESLEDLRLEVEREKLEAEREEARKRKEMARKETADLYTPQPQSQPKTRIDRINELEKEIRKLREAIAKNLEKTEKSIEEEGKIRGLTAQEIEDKKDLERARWGKIEMEETEKLERKYR